MDDPLGVEFGGDQRSVELVMNLDGYAFPFVLDRRIYLLDQFALFVVGLDRLIVGQLQGFRPFLYFLLQALLGLVQADGHLVDGGLEIPYFATTRDGDINVVLASTDAVHSRDNCRQGPVPDQGRQIGRSDI